MKKDPDPGAADEAELCPLAQCPDRRRPGSARRQNDAQERRLLRELQAREIELEIQNEKLRQAKVDIDAGLHRYATAVESAMDGYAVLSLDARFLEVNTALCALSGYSRDELQRLAIRDVEAAETEREIADHAASIAASGRERFESRWRRKDGALVDIEVAVTYSPQGGEFFLFAHDITERKRAQHQIAEYLRQLEASMLGTVRAVSYMVELRDPYTAGHERRVGALARAIGAELGLTEDRCKGLEVIGLVHDVGKIAVPAGILSRPAKLTPVEFELIKMHPQCGYDILKDVECPWPLAEIILQHHERLDGSGYPQGLKGEQIRLEARIIAVADVVEAMSSHRPHRHSLGIEAALEEILTHRGTRFDAAVVDACVKLFREKGYGLG